MDSHLHKRSFTSFRLSPKQTFHIPQIYEVDIRAHFIVTIMTFGL
jgi:hypothetical protein